MGMLVAAAAWQSGGHRREPQELKFSVLGAEAEGQLSAGPISPEASLLGVRTAVSSL